MSYHIEANPDQKNIIITGEPLNPFKEVKGSIITNDEAILPFTPETADVLFNFLRGEQFTMSLRTKRYLRVLKDREHLNRDNWVWSLDLYTLKDEVINPKSRKLRTAWDLIHYMPLRYIDKSHPQNITDLVLDTWAVVVGEIQEIKYIARADAVIVTIRDITGATISSWFFRQRWLVNQHHEGDTVVLSGTFSSYLNKYTGVSENRITNATIDAVGKYESGHKVVPVYSEKAGKKKWVTTREVENLLNNVGWIEDPVPDVILKKYGLMTRNEAYRKIHFPDSIEEAVEARKRIAFDDFVRLQVFLLQKKENEQENRQGNQMVETEWAEQFINSLPFNFTGAQNRVIGEIMEDMASDKPMRRLLHGDVGSGKAQPLYSKVLTPDGFKRMGDMQVGDTVMTPDGGTDQVVGVYPQGNRPVYEISFSDGTKARADENHLWHVRRAKQKDRKGLVRSSHRFQNRTTKELLNDIKDSRGNWKWFVEYPVIGDFGHEWPSLLDPYTIGAMLGDGGLNYTSCPRFTATEEGSCIVELLNKDFNKLGAELTILYQKVNPVTGVTTNNYGLRKKKPRLTLESFSKEITETNVSALVEAGFPLLAIKKHLSIPYKELLSFIPETVISERQANKATEELRRLGLLGHTSHTKYVPKELLSSNREARLALLQGLMDTGGYVPQPRVKKPGQGSSTRRFSFCSVSEQLVNDVAYLVRSLGGRARVVKKNRKSGISWEMSGWLNTDDVPFRHPRKQAIYEATPKAKAQKAKAITSIEYVGEEPTQCIKLSRETGLYITDDFTVTHNTEIATTAALTAVCSGKQVALLVPTGILATQLYERFVRDISRAGLGEEVKTALLHTGLKVGERRKTLEGVASGEINILVGTHSILNKQVEFHDLGLIVIDEQHKFGTQHRQALTDNFMVKSDIVPDLLTMSATPIPRTMSQTIYGDMDLSVIDEYPADRKPVLTFWDEDDTSAWEAIRSEVAKGHQAYVIAALVDESESEKMENVENATQTHLFLQTSVFPEMKVGLVHGKMKQEEKNEILESFYKNETQVLVSTSVIEVGVNVPNATVMVILNANRFGIASLHQIRGRVGRGSAQGYCYLVGEATNPDAEERLNALVASNDGFWLAEKDLEIRGEGSLLKNSQHGDNDLIVGNLREHRKLLEIARRVAKAAANSEKMRQEVEFLFGETSISA